MKILIFQLCPKVLPVLHFTQVSTWVQWYTVKNVPMGMKIGNARCVALSTGTLRTPMSLWSGATQCSMESTQTFHLLFAEAVEQSKHNEARSWRIWKSLPRSYMATFHYNVKLHAIKICHAYGSYIHVKAVVVLNISIYCVKGALNYFFKGTIQLLQPIDIK